MSINRLSQIAKKLKLLRERKNTFEQETMMNTGLAKAQTNQYLKEEIQPQIREYEEEYWHVLAQQTKTVEIPEPEAEVIVAEIIKEVGQMEVQCEYPNEVIQMLQEIRDKLNQPGLTAATKLKGVISTIPPFVGISYEGELDTDYFLKQHFPRFQQWTQTLGKNS
ncbi:hypothetical protein [Tychonema sp. BBK16]|uniref:hypothetical protein n=1 Tax=Tychonema sp. BBK16 TaxID=2699888 RepID=UPI001F20124D|nr:hypothetical protein [Tychonema sp. BBK16]MCF6371708.1 hypothetical protein [Tychonema sp. BBK16]